MVYSENYIIENYYSHFPLLKKKLFAFLFVSINQSSSDESSVLSLQLSKCGGRSNNSSFQTQEQLSGCPHAFPSFIRVLQILSVRLQSARFLEQNQLLHKTLSIYGFDSILKALKPLELFAEGSVPHPRRISFYPVWAFLCIYGFLDISKAHQEASVPPNVSIQEKLHKTSLKTET